VKRFLKIILLIVWVLLTPVLLYYTYESYIPHISNCIIDEFNAGSQVA
jgi:hypothetical protein